MKPKLSFEEQIAHMKEKGILFTKTSEEEAANYLQRNNYYFRLKAYAKNYDKYQSTDKKGKYINLEFAYLQELTVLDMCLRNLIILMAIDVEHYLKVGLLRDVCNEANEDGYQIVSDIFYEDDLNNMYDKMENESTCRDLIMKYRDDTEKFAVWNIVEILSFGDFTRLYEGFYNKYDQYSNHMVLLKPIRMIRNAAAHNNCLLNSLKTSYSRTYGPCKEVCTFLIKHVGLKSAQMNKKMDNTVLHNLTVLIYALNRVVTSDGVKNRRMNELKEFIEGRAIEHIDYFEKNHYITSAIDYVKKIVDFFIENDYNKLDGQKA